MLRGKRLLFVDDEPTIRVTLSLILRRYGFSVIATKVAQAVYESEITNLIYCFAT
jgi:CheY-like chemotaxis protein